MGNPLVRFCEGQGNNHEQDDILWHRRESRRTTEKTNLVLPSWESPAYSKKRFFSRHVRLPMRAIGCTCRPKLRCLDFEDYGC